MEVGATTIRKNGKSVTIEPCFKVIDGKIMRFHIAGTEKYYMLRGIAMRRANEILLKEALSEKQFAEREKIKNKIKHCNRIIKVHKCLTETATFVKRWDGIIYLETKKRLCAELQNQLAEKCKEGGFKNAGEAIGFKEYHTVRKHIRK